MKKLLNILLITAALLVTAVHAQFSADLSNGDIGIKISAEPETIDPAKDLMLTITIENPASLKVMLPDLQDRFQGFSLAEDFSTEPVEAGGRMLQSQRWKLTPKPAADRYRLAPFAVTVSGSETYTFATKPIIFPKVEERTPVTGKPEVTPEPEWIAPTAKSITLWIFAGIGVILLIALILYGLTKISSKVKEFRMTPIERAMTELERLLNRNLPDKGLYKDFYVELTMVVRRYIERSHNVRAPEQTTEEFLAAATDHPDFTEDVLKQLKIFLESADLVKFAGQKADKEMTDQAAEKARSYIKSDADLLIIASREPHNQNKKI
ncbi:MAG: hypothetical protein PF904_11660 [Kiritimatiellae bacterium]|jgi:hypothetical protein|nr:hypothetical protein [Kiritimatiellia bacterium]